MAWSATAAATKFKVTWSPVGAGKGEQRQGGHAHSWHKLASVAAAMGSTFPNS